MTPGDAVPVTVLTGFLGAGKTTLLNRLLRLPAMDGTAVIVNEFGDVGIDHLLVDHVAGDTVMLTTGCLCCMARGDLAGAIASLLERRRGGSVAFRRIVIETTGLADPGPVINALLPGPELACRFDRLITVVDAAMGVEMLDRFEEARRQVALADLLVLSKTDRLSGSDPTAAILRQRLGTLNPWAPVCLSRDVDACLGATASSGERLATSHRPGHEHLHGIEALSLRAETIEGRQFDRFLDRLLDRHGMDLLRLKGLVATLDDPARPILVNVVQHCLHPGTRLDGWPDGNRGTRLAVITRRVASAAISDLWSAFFGPPGIDRPDAAALTSDRGPGLF